MKKLLKTILCFTLAASLCIGFCTAAFAEEAAESEMSMEDLLALLNSLSGNEDTDGDDAEAADAALTVALHTLGPVTFAIPADWSEEDMDGQSMFYAPDFMTYITAMYQNSNGISVDLHDQTNIDALAASLGGTEALQKQEYFTVCGQNALWITALISTGSVDISAEAVLVETGDGLFMMSSSGILESPVDLLAALVNCISIDGAEGATDFASAYEGTPLSVAIGEAAPVDITDSLGDSSEGENEPADSSKPAAEGLSFNDGEDLVLIDDDNCTVSITGVSTDDDYYGLVLDVFVENKTDINLYYTIEDVSVNGYMLSPWWGETVSSGHKSNSDIHFYTEDLEANNITDVHDIDFTILVRDDDDWSADPIEYQTFTIYPFGSDVPEQPVQEFADDAIVLVDNDDITMIITGFETDSYYYMAKVYLENKTDIELEYSISDATAVNGYEISPYFYKEVQPGKKMNTEISWYLSDLSDNRIDTVEELDLDISVSEADNWSADPIFEEMTLVQVQ